MIKLFGESMDIRDRSLFMEGGEGKIRGGVICINKLLEGGGY